LRLFTRTLVCALDVDWLRLDERAFSFPTLDNFLSFLLCDESDPYSIDTVCFF